MEPEKIKAIKAEIEKMEKEKETVHGFQAKGPLFFPSVSMTTMN